MNYSKLDKLQQTAPVELFNWGHSFSAESLGTIPSGTICPVTMFSYLYVGPFNLETFVPAPFFSIPVRFRLVY